MGEALMYIAIFLFGLAFIVTVISIIALVADSI